MYIYQYVCVIKVCIPVYILFQNTSAIARLSLKCFVSNGVGKKPYFYKIKTMTIFS